MANVLERTSRDVGYGPVSLWGGQRSHACTLLDCSVRTGDTLRDPGDEDIELLVRVEIDSVEAIALEHVLTGEYPAQARVGVRAQLGGWEVSGLARVVEAAGSWDGPEAVLVRFEIVRDQLIRQADQGLLF